MVNGNAQSDGQHSNSQFPDSQFQPLPYPLPTLWRMILSGNRTRIGKAVARIKAEGTVDDYAATLLRVRRRHAFRKRGLFGLTAYISAYTDRERRSALTALSLLWGTMGRELGIALDPKATHFERQRAHQALIRRRDQRATLPLIDALLTGHAVEDWQCLPTIGALGDQNAAVALLRYLGLDENAPSAVDKAGDKATLDVSLEVGKTLKILNARTTLPIVQTALHSSQPFQRAVAALTLAGWADTSDKTIIRLLALLDDPTAEVRTAAATALGELRMTSAYSALQAHLTDTDPDVRAAIEQAIEQVSMGMAQRSVGAAKLKRPNPVWR